MQDVSLYYDELHRWTAKDSGFQTFSGFENDTIHRFLVDPQTGAFSPDTIYRFIDPAIADLDKGDVLRGLDAGCGYGGSCFHGLKAHGGHWTGITVSEQQWRYANGLAQARGLTDRIRFILGSYDDPIAERFDVAIAIESLIHSADPDRTLSNLAAALEPAGRLIVVDDMPLDAVPDRDRGLLADFRAAWRCPVAPSAERWLAAAQSAGLHLVARVDLSHLMRPRPEADLDAALADLGAQRSAKTEQGFGRLSDAEIGGLHLERLLGRGTIRYTMLVLEKPVLKTSASR